MTEEYAGARDAWSFLREHRFGMFIHWGPYALAARHEWVREHERMSDERYQPYVDNFVGDLFDADSILGLAARSGVSFATFTTKHHDGYCLWPAPGADDYSVALQDHGRDFVREFVDACARQRVAPGLYYSLLDWHHRDFAIDGFHPLRDDEDAKRERANADAAVYREYLHGHIADLMSSYGELSIGFFDFSYPKDYPHEGGIVWGGKGREAWGSDEILRTVRTAQPTMLINDRLDIDEVADFVTPEQYQPDGPMMREGVPVPWIAVQTIDGSWGYDRDNRSPKHPVLILRMMIDTVSHGGSFMLNVGPNGRGEIAPTHVRIFEEVGEWMRLHHAAIDGCAQAEFQAPADARYTQIGNRLFLHLFAWPFAAVHLPGLAGRVRYAQFLHDASEVQMSVSDPDALAFTIFEGGKPEGTLTLHLPTVAPDVLVPVIELILESEG